jgi:hypothetical protein
MYPSAIISRCQTSLRVVVMGFLLLSVEVLGQNLIQIPFAELRAGQFNVGLSGILQYTLPKAEDAYKNGYTLNGTFYSPGAAGADAFMRDKAQPVILGPDGYHLVDGHHRTMGNFLLSEKYSDFPAYDYFYLVSNGDLSGLSMDDFWKTMQKGDGFSPTYVWLNNRGVPSSVAGLPFIPGLTDDALRTLAADVSDNLFAYDMLEDPVTGYAYYYQEFYWADYLRDKVFLSGAGWETTGGNPNAAFVSSSYDAVAAEAARLCHLPEASQLPGFIAVPEPGEVALMAFVGMCFVVRGAWMRFKPGRC